MMIQTIYGPIDKISLFLYNEELKSRTFSLLYMYEQQPFITFQKKVKDLICGAISFEKIKLQKHRKFCQYIETLTAIIEPQPLDTETKHNFVKRHIFDAISLLEKMFSDFGEAVDEQ
jgi:hypothetical protein